MALQSSPSMVVAVEPSPCLQQHNAYLSENHTVLSCHRHFGMSTMCASSIHQQSFDSPKQKA